MHCALFAALASLLLALPGCGRSDARDVPDEPGGAVVVDVVDGDTLKVRLAESEETVRLIGVDTPETKHPSKPVQCFGKEASAFTSRLVPPGTEIQVVRDVEARDRFGRLLAYVYRLSDDLFVNLELVRQGYALVATFPPNVAHTDEFLAAAAEARQVGRGLWSACE